MTLLSPRFEDPCFGGDVKSAPKVSHPARKIVFVLPGIGAGGSEHVVSMLCNHFASLGWAVTLLTFEMPGTDAFYAHAPSVRIERLGLPARKHLFLGGLFATVARFRRLKAALISAQPDVIVSFLTRTNVLSLLARNGLGIPIIVSERNNPELQEFGPVWSLLRDKLYAGANGLVTMTRGAMGFFPPSPGRICRVIPNHAHISEAAIDVRREGRRLVAVGRLVPQKGFDLLLEAFARVSPEFPGWTLTIWGEGPERPALEALRDRFGLNSKVLMPGNTAAPGAWTKSADLFVLSSRFEGWGLVVGEALAAGIPVLSFDCKWGPSEMITDGVNGRLVEDGDVDALAYGLHDLLNNDALRMNMSAAARDSMRKFAPHRITRQWQDLIEDVLSHPFAPPGTLSHAAQFT
jgi:glycosyltransferase involved in cell wall biosynthesis